MPVIKSAIKKLRQDRKHERQNDILRSALKNSVRNAKKTKNGKSVAKAISVIDKASKNNIIHKNKASRLKASLTKLSKPASIKASTGKAPTTTKRSKTVKTPKKTK